MQFYCYLYVLVLKQNMVEYNMLLINLKYVGIQDVHAALIIRKGC